MSEKNEIESYDNNCAFRSVRSQVVNTTLTPVSNSINKVIPGKDVNIKHRNMDG